MVASAPARRARSMLVSGANSGLGNAVHCLLGGIPFVRGMSLDAPAITDAGPFDCIVHCAFNAAKSVTMDNASRYVEDNFLLTQRLLDLPHRKFVYISSLEVHPRLGGQVQEDENFDLSQLSGAYAFTKLFSEIVVRQRSSNFVILRPSSLLGRRMRPNTTLRALTERRARLFLAPQSRFNYVLHEDVAAVIELAISNDLTGTYHMASQGCLVLEELVAQLGLDVQFGNYLYNTGALEAGRAAALMPVFSRPSWQTLNRFIDALGPSFIGTGRLRGP